jgi:hypothetical protein
MQVNMEKISRVEEVICLDVSRSEHQMPGVDSEELRNVLRTYALFNPEVEYCQGMNYIAGLLLMVFQDPEIAFYCLITIVGRFGIAALFDQEFPRLKQYFYILDRLIGLKDQALSDHFKEEGVTTTLFASAWFITMYTNTLKENAENGVVNESLLQIWDYFLIAGWRGL